VDDEMVTQLAAELAGMSAGDIEAMIRASSNADAFQDPALIAAFLASRAGG
jgi:hypothetical protein